MPILTTISVQSYRPKASRREIADAKSTGLFLIIQPSGAKSWALRFRRPDGRPAKMTLGPVDFAEVETKDEPELGAPLSLGQARQLAASIHRQRTRGVDVIASHQADKARQRDAASTAAANTVTACAVEFVAEHKTKRGQRPRRWREDAAALGLHYLPGCDPATTEPRVTAGSLADVWRDRPVSGIDGHDIHVVVDAARKHGSAGRSRKLYAELSIMFSWLLRQRRVTSNPCVGVYRPGPPPSRERVLSDEEIRCFWKAAGRMSAPVGAMLRMLLLTGARLREVGGMPRAELGENGIWQIPGSRTKNSRPLALPLPELALQTIAAVPRIGDEFVFSFDGQKPISNFSHPKKELDSIMAEINGKPVTPWRLHDLRRSAASGMAALGVQLPVVEKILNHVSGSFAGVLGIYQRYRFEPEMRDALQRWAMHIEGLVSDKPSNVAKLSDNKRKRR
jgi:integrase